MSKKNLMRKFYLPANKKALEVLNKYIRAESKINELFFYTRKFCKDYCHKKPAGCCDYNWYGHKIPQNNIGEIFEKARRRVSQKHKDKNICKYLSLEKGCMLEHLKNPSCIGMLCSTICNRLKKDFGIVYDSAKNIDFFDKILKNKISKREMFSFYKEIEDMKNTIKSRLGENNIKTKKIRKFWVYD